MFNINLNRRGSLAPRPVSIPPSLAFRFHKGDVDAFTEIYGTLKGPLFSFLLKRMESVSAAEDLSHDIFLKLFRARHSYNPSLDFVPWFWTVSRNTLNDHLRKRMSGGISVSIEGPEADEEGISALIATADIESLVLKYSDRTVLLKFLDQLTRLQREALSLRLVQRLSYHEIARQMCLSLSAVKSLIHRAQNTLKHSFRKENPHVNPDSLTTQLR